MSLGSRLFWLRGSLWRGSCLSLDRLTFAAERREVCASAGAVFEQARFTHPQVHDATVVDQIVFDGLDKARVWLWMLVRGLGRRQFAGLVVNVVVPLCRAVDAVGPVQACVEPLRAVWCRALCRQHIAHLVKVRARVFLGREIAAFPTPIGPSACQTVEHLLGGRLSAHCSAFCWHGWP